MNYSDSLVKTCDTSLSMTAGICLLLVPGDNGLKPHVQPSEFLLPVINRRMCFADGSQLRPAADVDWQQNHVTAGN
jgi:hypothetical protein